MAITHTEQQVAWSTINFVDVTTGGNQTSDILALDDTCVNAQITLKADNQGTPTSTDIIYFWLQQSAGDPDNDAGGDEYDTFEGSLFLAAIDTSATNNDPGVTTVPLPIPQKGIKIYAEGATAGTTNTIRVSAVVLEQRAA